MRTSTSLFAGRGSSRPWGWLLTLGVACAVVAGCSGGLPAPAAASHISGTPRAQASTTTSAQPVSRTGAPTAFTSGNGTALPTAASANTSIGGDQGGPAPVSLAGYTAFITTGTAVQVVDTATGHVLGSVVPYHTVPDPAGGDAVGVGSAPAPPLVADVNGEQVALAGYVIEIAGHGTTPSSLAVEVDAVTASATISWDIIAPLPGQPGQAPSLYGGPDVDFVGVSGDIAVAAVGDSEDGFSTVAFDLATRRPLWQSQTFLASAVVGSTVIGTTDPTGTPEVLGTHDTPDMFYLAGLSAAQGKTLWQESEAITGANVQQSAPGKIMVEAADYSTGNDIISVLNASTGQGTTLANQSEVGEDSLPWSCAYDGQSVVVCDDAVPPAADFAVNGVTGNVLWQLPDAAENRTSLTVTAVYDGYVYGYTSAGSVVLNAETGKDVNDSPGVAPLVVDPDVGIADSPKTHQLRAYVTTAS